jgi:RNA polymerase-binding transcription factor DksA
VCDEIDALTDRAAAEAEFARRAHAIEEAWKLAQPPLDFCEDCEDDLTSLRRQMRATRCVACQDHFEKRQKLFGRVK